MPTRVYSFEFDSTLVQEFCVCDSDSALAFDCSLDEGQSSSVNWLLESKSNFLLQDFAAGGAGSISVVLLVASTVGVLGVLSILFFRTYFLLPVGGAGFISVVVLVASAVGVLEVLSTLFFGHISS